MKKYIQPTIILLLVILVFNIKQCNIPKVEYIKERYRDTIIKTNIDTIMFEKTVTKTKLVLDTITNYVYPDGTNIYRFRTSIDDSLLSGKIMTEVEVNNDSLQVLSQYIDYYPKFPKYIYRTDSIFIKDSTVITKLDNKVNFFLGFSTSYLYKDTSVDIYPEVALQFKNKSIINFGFSPFTQTFILGTRFKIQKNK